jgi:hypothetical protein
LAELAAQAAIAATVIARAASSPNVTGRSRGMVLTVPLPLVVLTDTSQLLEEELVNWK